ncbi:MAG: undecaprenyldiphospho-muramoylpentapeptide beta-N-acetylglucosaminyltransferase, partial [Slackia sp.]|nr:undecaprenyldiphospho-muramoylpentapeptide beta-N-acetylglucosaminyltransferase [Slackia sp.]
SYVESGAARMIADADIDGEEFAARLLELVCDEGLRASMREAARGAGARNAALALADVVYSVVGVSGAAS